MSALRALGAGLLAAALASALFPGAARAEAALDDVLADDPVTSTTLRVRASPIFGEEAASSDGWTEIGVQIENTGAAPRKGTVEVVSRLAWSMRENGFVTRAPFHVVPGRSAVVKLPVHGFDNQPSTWS